MNFAGPLRFVRFPPPTLRTIADHAMLLRDRTAIPANYRGPSLPEASSMSPEKTSPSVTAW
jgi:hypothetical protein